MCISCPIDDKWGVLIEFVIFFVLQGLNIGNNLGVFFVVFQQVSKCNTEIAKADLLFCADGFNMTSSALQPDADYLSLMSIVLITFVGIGALLFIVHVGLLVPNVIKSSQEKDMEVYRENAHPYYRNVLKIHATLLVVETLISDIPTGGVVMEIIAQLWKRSENNNCWECVAEEALAPNEMSLEVSRLFLSLTLLGIAFIALYKGMMPIYLWIGNPFCFPCIPLRLVVVFPGGMIALAMTFGPIMGIAKNRLLPVSPPEMIKEIKEVAETFFSIGMIFWGIFGIIFVFGGACWWKMCRNGDGKDDCCAVCCS